MASSKPIFNVKGISAGLFRYFMAEDL